MWLPSIYRAQPSVDVDLVPCPRFHSVKEVYHLCEKKKKISWYWLWRDFCSILSNCKKDRSSSTSSNNNWVKYGHLKHLYFADNILFAIHKHYNGTIFGRFLFQQSNLGKRIGTLPNHFGDFARINQMCVFWCVIHECPLSSLCFTYFRIIWS